eukprot:648634-Pyramimonas_sp.AAC.1
MMNRRSASGMPGLVPRRGGNNSSAPPYLEPVTLHHVNHRFQEMLIFERVQGAGLGDEGMAKRLGTYWHL